MKLRWPEFEQRLRRRLRKKVEASAALKKELRRNRKSRETPLGSWLSRLVFFGIVFSMIGASIPSLSTLEAAILLFSIGAALNRAGQLWGALYFPPRLDPFRLLPISDEDVFWFQWRSFSRNSLWSLVEFTAAYGVVANRVGFDFSSSIIMGLAGAAAQCIVILGLSTLLVAFKPKFPYSALGTLLLFSPLGLLFFSRWFRGGLAEGISGFANWLPGTGWIFYALGAAPTHGFSGQLIPALATGVAVLCLPLALQKLCREYRMPGPLVEATPEMKRQAAEAARPVAAPGEPEADPHAALKARIRSREFLEGMNWPQSGWMERIAFRCLKPEERLAAEFLCGGKVRWTQDAKTLAVFSLLILGALAMCPVLLVFAPILGIIALVPFVTGHVWPGTRAINMGGMLASPSSFYPLTYRQITRVILKGNLSRFSIFPLLVGGGAVFAIWRHGFAPGTALAIGCKLAGIALALQPGCAFLPLCLATSVTPRSWTSSIQALLVLAGAACGGAVLFSHRLWLTAIMLLLLGGVSYAALRFHEFAYNHNWFDLQRKPDRGNTDAQRIEIRLPWRKKS